MVILNARTEPDPDETGRVVHLAEASRRDRQTLAVGHFAPVSPSETEEWMRAPVPCQVRGAGGNFVTRELADAAHLKLISGVVQLPPGT